MGDPGRLRRQSVHARWMTASRGAWGLEEYSGIAEEIGQEIDRRGGSAAIEDLVATLVRQFSLRDL